MKNGASATLAPFFAGPCICHGQRFHAGKAADQQLVGMRFQRAYHQAGEQRFAQHQRQVGHGEQRPVVQRGRFFAEGQPEADHGDHAAVIQRVELDHFGPADAAAFAIGEEVAAQQTVCGHQRQHQRQRVDAEVHQILRLEQQSLQQQTDGKAEQRGDKAKDEVDRRCADEMELRRADRQVEDFHEDREEHGGQQRLDQVVGPGEQSG